MSPFEYLSVLVSIILGLAIAQLLSGAARLIQLRHRVRMHATTLCWMAMLFLLNIQIWWAAFARREAMDWNFFEFMFYLLMPIIAFLLSHLVLPELGDEDEVRLAEHFDRNRPWFFALFVALLLVSLGEQSLRRGFVRIDVDFAFHALFLATALAAARIRSAGFQLATAVTVLGLVCGYIAWLFMTLR